MVEVTSRTLEFHDSTLAAIEVDGGVAVLELSPGHVHQWEARDGQWVGTGWQSVVRIRLANASATGEPPSFPADITEGTVVLDGGVPASLVALPLRAAGHVRLTLALGDGTQVIVTGIGATIETIGSATMLEALPAEFGPVVRSRITCPLCGASRDEPMPADACVYFYQCTGCGTVLRPKAGDCCVFCSFGTVRCPPMQVTGGCCADAGPDDA